MSFTPGDRQVWREAIGSREVEADLVTRDYAHRHPEADNPLPKRPHTILQRLLRALRRRRTE